MKHILEFLLEIILIPFILLLVVLKLFLMVLMFPFIVMVAIILLIVGIRKCIKEGVFK